jgi:hypothetical protein
MHIHEVGEVWEANPTGLPVFGVMYEIYKTIFF